MRNIVNSYVQKFKEERRARWKVTGVLLTLALVVTAGVFWQLHATGIALTNETYCGMEEHTHSEDCYETVLVCGLEESEGHTHTEDCYTEEQVLVCELEESEGHTHTDECYETGQVLTCEQEEAEDHTHTEDCYEEQLVCGLEEHTHTVDCLSDETADVETAYDWASTLPDMTGVLADDVVAIAQSQLGYTESTRNFVLADDGETRKGYTRYGAWYGDGFEYVDWDAMFASFCLYYAGIDESTFPLNSGAYAWATELESLGYYDSAADAEPAAGDLIFFDTDSDGRADRVGIVTAVDESSSKLTVIEGDYTDGDTDTVAENTCNTGDTTILGYGVLPVEEQSANNGIMLTAADDEIQWTETTYTNYTERTGTKTYTSEGENYGQEISLNVTYIIEAYAQYQYSIGYIDITISESQIIPDTYYFNIDVPAYCVIVGNTGTIAYDGYTIGTYEIDSSGLITMVFNENVNYVFDIDATYNIADMKLDLMSKNLEDTPTADNNYTATYTLTINGGGGDANGEESLVITDTMLNLAYVKGSLTIVNSTYTSDELVLVDEKPSADEDGKTFYSVSWDGVEDTSGTVSGTLTITIWYPYKDSTYTISYDAQVSTTGHYDNTAATTTYNAASWTSNRLSNAVIWYKASVAIKKMDETETVALKDAEYGLYNAATGGLVASGKTDGDGMLTFTYNAAEGIIYSFDTQFYLQEITAPDGYELDTTKHYFYFVKEGTTPGAALLGTKIVVDSSSNLTYYDENGTEITEGYITLTDILKTYTMPETGGAGAYGYRVTGTALLGGVVLLMYRRRRKLRN